MVVGIGGREQDPKYREACFISPETQGSSENDRSPMQTVERGDQRPKAIQKHEKETRTANERTSRSLQKPIDILGSKNGGHIYYDACQILTMHKLSL